MKNTKKCVLSNSLKIHAVGLLKRFMKTRKLNFVGCKIDCNRVLHFCPLNIHDSFKRIGAVIKN